MHQGFILLQDDWQLEGPISFSVPSVCVLGILSVSLISRGSSSWQITECKVAADTHTRSVRLLIWVGLLVKLVCVWFITPVKRCCVWRQLFVSFVVYMLFTVNMKRQTWPPHAALFQPANRLSQTVEAMLGRHTTMASCLQSRLLLIGQSYRCFLATDLHLTKVFTSWDFYWIVQLDTVNHKFELVST